MQPDQDDQNQEPQGRSFNIPLSRDALFLTGALGFLALALVLAFLIPAGSNNEQTLQPTTNATLSAGRGTASVASVVATRPGATTPGTGPSNGYPNPGGQTGGYPQPGVTSATNQQAARETTAPEPSDETTDEDETPDTEVTETDEAVAEETGGRATATQGATTVATNGALAQATLASQPSASGAQPGPGSYPAPPGSGNQAVPTFDPARPTTAPAPTDSANQPPTPAPTEAQPPTPVQPTNTVEPAPTREPPPTREPTTPPEPTEPPPPTLTPAPTTPPIDIIQGTVRWTPDKGPIIVSRDLSIPRGATLLINPGTQVRLGVGVSIFVDGSLLSLGRPDAQVSFVADRGQRWEGVFANPGSAVTFDSTQISGAGSGGTMLTSEGGNLLIRGSRFYDNGGNIHITNSRLEMRDSEIAGNDMPYGAALEGIYGPTDNASYSYAERNFVTMTGNRIGGNRQDNGAPSVKLSNTSRSDTLNLDLQRNYIVGGSGGNLILSTDGPLKGALTCNTFKGESIGLDLRSETKQIPGFDLTLRQNYIDDHTPPIIPTYLKYGIGRGIASEVVLDARGNWWGDATGPYEPNANPLGRGDAVGTNIDYSGWLTSAPDCAPR